MAVSKLVCAVYRFFGYKKTNGYIMIRWQSDILLPAPSKDSNSNAGYT